MNLHMLHEVVRSRVRATGAEFPTESVDNVGQSVAASQLSGVEQRAVLAWQRVTGTEVMMRALFVNGVLEWMCTLLPSPPPPSQI